jgi:acetoacetate decarboxylase
VPQPLVPLEGDLVYAWVNHFPTIGLGEYNEAIVSIPVELRGRKGQYIAYIYLDSDMPIGAGREIWGFPKKMARVASAKHGALLTGSVERGGIEILRVSLAGMQPAEPEALSGFSQPIYNFKLIPSAEEGAPPAVCQLTATTLQNIKIRTVVQGHATVEHRASPADPVYQLEPIEMLGGYYCELDFDLGYGEIVHDYIKQSL